LISWFEISDVAKITAASVMPWDFLVHFLRYGRDWETSLEESVKFPDKSYIRCVLPVMAGFMRGLADFP